ncbi:hypothetical protein ACL02U_21065 [Streptomyces sp. MS06]|uniref:hypothetical protein n=1 Tax=Streptomyces sp. MS06 TaxID=3385974 RepID=UPI0039A13E15
MTDRPSPPARRRRATSITLRVLGGIAVTLLAVAAAFSGLVMRLDGTHCEIVLMFTSRCDALTHRTIQLQFVVTLIAWAAAVSGLHLPPARATRRCGYATAALLAGWLTAHLIAYR